MSPSETPARSHAPHPPCDVLIVGSGAAGLT